jgi:hypothetical protein
MKITPKSAQETAAIITSAYADYSDYDMPKSQAKRLKLLADALQAELEAMEPYLLTDAELATKLQNIQASAIKNGVWQPLIGQGAEKRLAFAIQKQKSWGFSEKEAIDAAHKTLEKSGYSYAVEIARKEFDTDFKRTVKDYLTTHKINPEDEKIQVAALQKNIVDIKGPASGASAEILKAFPSGNFLYHGAATEQVVQILDSGALTNAWAIRKKEDEAAVREGREAGLVRHNSGYEAISWSMNGIDALPGDRYHLAGFLLSPEAALSRKTQLAVPSRPSPNEVVLVDSKLKPSTYYSAKTQVELYEAFDRNSVLGNILEMLVESLDGEPASLLSELPKLRSEEYIVTLRRRYSLLENGSISLDPELLSLAEANEEIPVAVIWLQALVDANRLQGTVFEGMNVAGIISSISEASAKQLYTELHKDADTFHKLCDFEVGTIAVRVEDMYLVAPRKDARTWLKVVARSQFKPRGVILYDDRKVKLENFASLHRGHHAELTKELTSVISPNTQGYIDYNDVLGIKFNDAMRVGRRRQVIAERYLTNRRVIRNVNGKLVLKRSV